MDKNERKDVPEKKTLKQNCLDVQLIQWTRIGSCGK